MTTNAKPTKVRLIDIDDDNLDQRLDNFLIGRLKGVPKSAIYRMIRKGEVRVNKGRAKPEYKLRIGDQVRIPPARVAASDNASGVFVGDTLKSQLERAILFEDDRLIVINKPSGLAVHGGSGVSLGLVEALRQIRPQQKFLELVHRLDRDTSGCLMVAKKRSELRRLHLALKEGSIQKTYQALVWGRWRGISHRVDAPLAKFQLASGERIVRVSADGKASLTLIRQIALYEQSTLIEAQPITGRTHQIRVHCQHSGHSIGGDQKYMASEQLAYFSSLGLNRLFLHAAQLAIPSEQGKTQLFKAPLPAELTAVLSRLSGEGLA